ncbi:MAG: sensor histidine kinase, partial [Flavobacteriales bacterium]
GTLPFHFYIPFIASSILLVVIYYLNYSILTPRFFFARKYVPYFLMIAGLLFLLLLVPEVDHLFEKHGPRDFHRVQSMEHSVRRSAAGRLLHFSPFEKQVFLMGILVLIVSTLMATVRRLRVAEREKSEAELSFLKAQINPHFLFNTLNSIYSLAYSKSEQAPSAIIKLSGLMRHVITDAQKDEVPLTQEIEYITNYIDL